MNKNIITSILVSLCFSSLFAQTVKVESFPFIKPDGIGKDFTVKCIWTGIDEVSYSISDKKKSFIVIYDSRDFTLKETIDLTDFKFDIKKFDIDKNYVNLFYTYKESGVKSMNIKTFDRLSKIWKSEKKINFEKYPNFDPDKIRFQENGSLIGIEISDYKSDKDLAIHFCDFKKDGKIVNDKKFNVKLSGNSVKFSILSEIINENYLWFFINLREFGKEAYYILQIDLVKGTTFQIPLDFKYLEVFEKPKFIKNDSIVEFAGLLTSNSRDTKYGWNGVFRQRINFKTGQVYKLVEYKFDDKRLREIISNNFIYYKNDLENGTTLPLSKLNGVIFNDDCSFKLYADQTLIKQYTTEVSSGAYMGGMYSFSGSIFEISFTKDGQITINEIPKKQIYKYTGDIPFDNIVGQLELSNDNSTFYIFNDINKNFKGKKNKFKYMLENGKYDPVLANVKIETSGELIKQRCEIIKGEKVRIYPDTFYKSNAYSTYGFGEYNFHKMVFIKVSI